MQEVQSFLTQTLTTHYGGTRVTDTCNVIAVSIHVIIVGGQQLLRTMFLKASGATDRQRGDRSVTRF